MSLFDHAGPDRRIRLVRRLRRIWVIPESSLSSFAEFDFPPVPLSLIQTLDLTGDQFWTRRRRCMTVALTIDPVVRCWSFIPPSQHCGPSQSIWDYAPGDYLNLGSHVLIGSFQTARLEHLLDAKDLVPHQDGLHLIRTLSPLEGHGLFFLRIGGETALVRPSDFYIDDFKLLIRRYNDRFQL